MSSPTSHSPPRDAPDSSSQDSVTAQDYIDSQLQLELDAREAMPYSFDVCTNPLGPLRQPVFSCKTCHPNTVSAPSFTNIVSTGAAAICYSCSISCHGDHELVEIFNKRNIVCDCGTEKIAAECTLRKVKGERIDLPEGKVGNMYCHNFWGKFCACDEDYDPHSERGTMYQCLLGDVCGEDWFHDRCIMGLLKVSEDATMDPETKVVGEVGVNGEGEGQPEGYNHEEAEDDDSPEGFPTEEFEHFICWLCVEKNPWLGRYAGTPGFLGAVYKQGFPLQANSDIQSSDGKKTANGTGVETSNTKKRNVDDGDGEAIRKDFKRAKTPEASKVLTGFNSNAEPISTPTEPEAKPCSYETLPPPQPTTKPFSIFLKEDFRGYLCRCASCLPRLSQHPILLEEEETYEPPLDDDDNQSVRSGGSLLDLGEKALVSVDRVTAINGVLAYNKLKAEVKNFLKPFADNKQPVSTEAVRNYFAELRGEAPIHGGNDNGSDGGGDNRREQSGY
ncbi:unnamed protein product [Tuber melanosporum]|uniref:(Perigord truffle) hypothetical protein n=1 Tax=Tuber melanosporum (strain Mel28) TaxID=656061 RepID=D5GAV8_TUBMM|nr:uncharacterized protein GSTUM_00005328001 [Tuber melanosporum]CAZ81651.1 unnamed protein product [Tuber melanosporum]